MPVDFSLDAEARVGSKGTTTMVLGALEEEAQGISVGHASGLGAGIWTWGRNDVAAGAGVRDQIETAVPEKRGATPLTVRTQTLKRGGSAAPVTTAESEAGNGKETGTWRKLVTLVTAGAPMGGPGRSVTPAVGGIGG